MMKMARLIKTVVVMKRVGMVQVEKLRGIRTLTQPARSAITT
jgi:hypothetical protein